MVYCGVMCCADVIQIIHWVVGTQKFANAQSLFKELTVIRLIRLLLFVKFEKYFRAWKLMKRVLRKKHKELLTAVFVAFVCVMFLSSIMYFVERTAQPDHFGSIPLSVCFQLFAYHMLTIV